MKKLLIILFTMVSFGLFVGSANAASGTIKVTSSSTVIVGNTVTVSVTLSSSSPLGAWEFDINYDSNYLKLTSSTAENNGTYFVNYGNGSTKSKTYTLKFKALKSGTTNITVGSYDIYAWDESSMSISKTNKKITIMTQEELEATYSKDNNLKDLVVKVDDEEIALNEEFAKDTLEYSVDVPTGTTSVLVEATRNDNSATVSGDGQLEVTEGINTIVITVTAQNGDSKTYTLTVNVEDKNPINVTIDGVNYTVVKSATLLETPLTYSQTTVNIDNYDIPAFINTTSNYILVGLKDEEGNISLFRYDDGEYIFYNEVGLDGFMLVPISVDKELDFATKIIKINNGEVKVYTYDTNSNYVIMKAMNLENGQEDLYLYDTINKKAILFDKDFVLDMNATIQNYTYVIIAFGSALVLMLILIFALLHSTKKKQRKINKFIQKQEAKLEATRKLNDVVEEVKKQIEPKENVPKKSKKELKKEQKLAKKNQLEDDNNIKEEEKVEDNDEVYDLFADDRKKKKK